MTGELAQIEALEEEFERLEQRHLRDEEEIRQLQRRLRLNRKLSVPVVYGDPERQFRFEVELEYLLRVEEPDRAAFPWPQRYHLGSEFLRSLDRPVRDGGITREKRYHQGEDRRGLCRRPVRPSQDDRQQGDQRVEDVCPRPATQTGHRRCRGHAGPASDAGSHSARRLRYWLLRNNEIELDRVSVHDEGLVK